MRRFWVCPVSLLHLCGGLEEVVVPAPPKPLAPNTVMSTWDGPDAIHRMLAGEPPDEERPAVIACS